MQMIKPDNTYKDLANSIADLFVMQARKTPDVTAICYNDTSLSYKELDKLSSELSVCILSQTLAEKVVGISSTKSLEMVIGLLAILKAGKTYVVLAPDYPEDRLRHIINDCSVTYCLFPKSETAFYSKLGIRSIQPAKSGDAMAYSKPPFIQPYACILYTSGSTGVPKGVPLKHDGLINFLQQHLSQSPATIKNALQFCHLGFDAAFQEIFSALLTGETLFICPEDIRLDAAKLLSFIIKNSINRIFLPFVSLQYVAEAAVQENRFPISLQEVVTGGESLKITPQIKKLFANAPGSVFINGYGPTETSICVSEFRLSGDTEKWPLLPPIGKPIGNTNIHLLSEALELVENGESGEICISGVGVADGYLNNEELTLEKFIYWKNLQGESIRVYRTGDIGRYLPDGNLEFLGRRDNQVKIRGNRVELGEIEVVLGELPGIQQVVVVMREDIPGNKLLVAYLESNHQQKKPSTVELRDAVKKKLPDYMIPANFVWVNELPKTASGKIDKKALPVPVIKRPDLSIPYKKPSSEKEKKIVFLWQELLQIDKIGVNDNFFDLGGNSLLAQKTVALLKEKNKYALPVTKLYQFPTAGEIAAYLESSEQKYTYHHNEESSNSDSDIAVIAMSVRFPGANTLEEYWQLLKEGRESIHFFEKEEIDETVSFKTKNAPNYVAARGIINSATEFDPMFFGISPRISEVMDPQQRIFLEIAWETLEKSGYTGASGSNDKIGVYAGCGPNTYYSNNVLAHPDLMEQIGVTQVTSVNDKDYISTRVAYSFDLKGPAVTVQSACSTSLLAIAQAVESIRNGYCDVALAGGVAIYSPIHTGHLYEEGAMFSKDGHTRTFDGSATGTVFSDGAGVVLLKKLSKAVEDGDTIFTIIKGVGLSNDGGKKGSFTAPSAQGQASAISMAIKDAGILSSGISYIEAHGTATPIGDPIEIEGLTLAFGEQKSKQFCAIGSAKSNMGHLTAAAGVAGLIKTALSLYHKQIPPSINFETPNPDIDFTNSPFYVNNKLVEWQSDSVRRAGVSSFGVGGTNVHIVIEEADHFDKEKISTASTKPLQLITWSAKSMESVENFSSVLSDYLQKNPSKNLEDIAYTLNKHRNAFIYRKFCVAASTERAIEMLNAESTHGNHKKLSEQIDEVVFMYPGQGAQYINMGKELYQTEIVFKEAIDECAALFLKETNENILSVIYPDDSVASPEDILKNTRYSQPALFCIGYALTRLWKSWGIHPSAFIGHSIGEFVAAHFAGIFSLEDAIKLITVRGKLMSELPKGHMLSVRAAADTIKPLLFDTVSIAAVNSPSLCVIAGNIEAIEKLQSVLTERNIPYRLLHTSHAFHSPMMDPVIKPFEAILESVRLNAPSIPIASTVTGKWLTKDEAVSPSYWAQHLRSTVLFSDAASTLITEGHKAFIELGPGNVTTTLLRQQAGSIPVIVTPTLERNEKNSSEYESLLKAVGYLWQHGVTINWNDFYKNEERIKITDLPTYVFNRKKYWVAPLPHKEQPLKTEVIEPTITAPPLTKTAPMRKEKIASRVRELLEDASGIEMLHYQEDATFFEIGFDSLIMTQVAAILKKEFNIAITFRQLSDQLSTINSLTEYLDNKLPANLFQSSQANPTPLNGHHATNSVNPATPTAPNQPSFDLLNQQLLQLVQQVALLQNTNQSLPAVPPAISNTSKDDLTAEEIVELKKPFGATAKIDKQSIALSEKQKIFLDTLIKRYIAKTSKSKNYTQKHRPYMADPRVVSGFKPATKEIVYSIVINKSKGSRLWDIDGNEYIDTLNGFGSNMLGHQPEFIINAVKQQIDAGYEVGPQHNLSGDVCKLICEFTGHDRVALCNTGSEAVLGAIRIARTTTNRSLIVAFSGSYHGIIDEAVVRGTKKLKTFPAASGIMVESVQNMLILDYGTPESLQVIKDRAHEIAGILVEPVQSRRPDFLPVDFLHRLRTLTKETGIALIFDEVITGFRMHPKGMQGILGIQADIATYGKVIGAGISIGVIAGKKQYMDALDGGSWQYGDDSMPEAGVTYFAGTFVRHPLALASTFASLTYMKEKGIALQENLTAKTKLLTSKLQLVCQQLSIPISIISYGSLWRIKFNIEISFSELLFVLLREKGIHILDGFPCYMTEAYTESDINTLVKAFTESVMELIEADFLPGKPAAHLSEIDTLPPITGAKMGKDPDGNVAWYISDPERPGKYLKVIH